MNNKKILLVLSLLLAFASCLQPDPPAMDNQELQIRQNGNLVSVIDIDPYIEPSENDRFFIYDTATGARIDNAVASSNTDTVRVQPRGMGFFIIGEKPSGMGIVTFRAGDKTAQLRVFVRNWNRDEVYRHTLYANITDYPFDPDVDYHADFYFYNQINKKTPPFTANRLAAYQLIVDRGFHYEAPDGLSSREPRNTEHGLTRVHADTPRETANRKVCPMPHIFQTHDPFLNRDAFAFTLHFENDGDMVGGFEDRQRLELKTMDTGRSIFAQDNEPDNFMYSTGAGDTFTYRWKFKLPHDFRVSSEYTHIHQIKPEGGDSGNPTFTLTGRRLRATGQEVLQLIYRGPVRSNGDPSVNWYPAQVPLEPFKGEWIRAETTITFDNPGAYRIRLVRIRDM